MNYAAAVSLPRSVQAMFFGLVRRTDIERLVRGIRGDMYRSNAETFGDSCARIAAIANGAAKPTRPDFVAQEHQEPDPRPIR